MTALSSSATGAPAASPVRKFATLMRREWLQYRFGWTIAALLPVAIGLLLIAFGQINLDPEDLRGAGLDLPALLTMASLAGGVFIVFIVMVTTALINVVGIARRDHGDRSVEFWLSMPVGHGPSLAAPMVTHLLVVPAAGLLIGLAGGALLSLLLVARTAGIGAWFTLPWGDIMPAASMLVLRALAGLPLGVLWLSPLILLLMLLTAYARGWGWVIFFVGLGLGSVLLAQVDQTWLADLLGELLGNAGMALFNGGAGGFKVEVQNGIEAMRGLPAWLLADLGHALRDLLAPLFPAALLFSAGCFWLLMRWRQRGASAAA